MQHYHDDDGSNGNIIGALVLLIVVVAAILAAVYWTSRPVSPQVPREIDPPGIVLPDTINVDVDVRHPTP